MLIAHSLEKSIQFRKNLEKKLHKVIKQKNTQLATKSRNHNLQNNYSKLEKYDINVQLENRKQKIHN